MRKEHPLAQLDEISLDQFCAWEHVLVSHHGGQFSGVTDIALKKLGLTRKVALSVTSFLLLPCILKNSDFIAVAPERVVKKIDHIVMVKPPVQVQGFTKTMAWHERTHVDPAQRWLRQIMWESCRDAER